MLRKSGFHVGLAMVFLFAFIVACSGGSNPVTGDNPGANEALASPRSSAGVDGNRMLWGYYNCTLDTANRSVDIVPARGVMMHVNAVEWMQPPGGSLSNLQIAVVDDSLWLTEGRFDLDVTLKHPFSGANQFTGFDVMGVFITDGHHNVQSQPGVTISDGGTMDATMLNPDGYTRWWNQDEFDDPAISIFSYIAPKLALQGPGLNAKLSPYKYFTDGLGATVEEGAYLGSNAAQRGMFGAGASNVRRYQLKWPMVGGVPVLRFSYAVVASWENPTPIPPVNIPGDFPVTANALEPVALSVADNSTLYFTSSTAGGDLNLDLEVYGWSALEPGQTIPGVVNRVILESMSSNLALPGGYVAEDPSTWGTVDPGASNSSVWHVDIPGLTPTAAVDANILVIFETKYDYDNGFGTGYPAGAPLCSYFTSKVHISPYNPGEDQPPYCETPVPEFSDRNILDIEDFTSNVGDPELDPIGTDWSVVPLGDPKNYVNFDPPAGQITVNWWNATNAGTVPGDYEVCVSVYNGEGWSECCTTVNVKPAPKIEPVAGQNAIALTPQPNQGAQVCDIAVSNPGTGSVGEIVVQDLSTNAVRTYRFNNAYSAPTGIATLDSSAFPAQFADPQVWEDYRHFDVNPNGAMLHITSGSNTQPSFVDPTAYNINDPKHSFVLPFFNSSGVLSYVSLFGDIGNAVPDPDAIPWKHFVDWSTGVIAGQTGSPNTRVYGLYTLSELWLPAHPAMSHPGTIWVAYSTSPYNNPATTLKGLGLPAMSSQYTSPPGPINDTNPAYMALGVDDENPVVVDWDPGTPILQSNLSVWYMLSGEATGTARKVHLVWLPENNTIGYFAYAQDIGTGSPWGVDFGNTAVPVDVEVVYSNKAGSNLDHHFNWVAVLLNTGAAWRVDVFRYEPLFPTLVKVGSFDGETGVPQAMDVDTVDHEMHVLYLDGSTYRVTVLHFVP